MDRLKLYSLAVLLGLLFAIGVTQGAATKAEYKVTRMSATEVGISCNDASEPVATKVGSTVILSCKQ